MRYGLMTEPQVGQTYDELLEAARWCEGNGLDVFARSDHYHSSKEAPHATDAFATLAGLARDTDSVELCILVSPITFRHPAVIAKNAATIDEMSGGRLRLGVGTGWNEDEHDTFGLELWPWAERFERLEEALGYIRAAFSDASGFSGRYYSLGPYDVRPRPTGPMPVVVGGTGAHRTPRLAGLYADEYNTFVSPSDAVSERVGRARQAAVDAGRDPDAIEVSVMGPVMIGKDERSYRARLEATAADRGRSPAEQEELYANHGIPAGSASRPLETIAALAEAGVSRYYIQQVGTVDYPALQEALEILA